MQQAILNVSMIPISKITAFITLFLILQTGLTAQNVQESSRVTFQQGLTLFENGQYVEAIPLFRQMLDQEVHTAIHESAAYYLVRSQIRVDAVNAPNYTEWFVTHYPASSKASVLVIDLAHQYKDNNRYRDAIEAYQKALNYPMQRAKKAEITYLMAEAAVEDGEYDEARDYFLMVSDNYRSSPWSPKALYARGRLYLEEENYEGSAEAFELLAARHPFDPYTRRIGTALGESYYQQRKFEDAIEAFRAAMPYLDDENRSKAIYLTAESYNALNNYHDAQRNYMAYINRHRGEDRARIAHYGLGWVFHKQAIYHWAASSFGDASAGDDDVARKALYYKAVNHKLSNRYDQALDAFRDFGQRFTSGLFVEEAYYEWAITAFEIGMYGEAIEVLLPLARDLESLKEPGKVLTLLGEAYYANNEYTRALQTFEIAEGMVDLDPAIKRQARFQRAWVLYSNQAYRQAQPDFESVYREAPQTDLGAEALFWSADSHYQYQNYGPASAQYARFINEFPRHELVGAANYALGWSNFMRGEFEDAIAPLTNFLNNYEAPPIALFPYKTDTQLRIGDAYYALGDYTNSLRYYNMAIGAEPGGDYAMFQVANSYYRANRNFEAVTQFRRLLRIYPFSSLREQAQYNVAYIYLNTGNYEQAITEFNTVISRFPGTEWAARSQYNIGDAYYNAGDYTRAIEAYSKVLETYPRSSYIIEAINGIQYAQLSAGDDDSSTDILEEFLSSNPTSATADRLRFRQAENLLQAGDYTGAVREFRQYLRITNNENLIPDAWFNLADAYLRTNQKAQAAEAYRTIVDDFSSSERAAPSIAALGRLSYESGNYQESKRYFTQLAERGSRYQLEAYLGLGEASLALNQINEARQNFERAISANPNSDAAKNGLGKVLLQDRRFEEARRIFNSVAEKNTTDVGAEAQLMVGIAWHRENKYTEALEAYSRVNVLFEAFDNWVAEAQYRTAEIYIVQGRRGDARTLLNTITERYHGTEAAVKAARLLQSN